MIAPTEHVAILACLLALVSASILFEYTRIGKLFPAAIGMLVGAIILANTGVLPHSAPVYTQITELAVPVAVFLFLLRANLREIVRQTGSMLRFYLIGAAATVVGVAITYAVLIVPDRGESAAVFIGMLVGGTPNVVGIAQAVQIDPTSLSAILAANVPAASLYLMAMAAAGRSATLQRWLPGKPKAPEPVGEVIDNPVAEDVATEAKTKPKPVPVKIESLHIAVLLTGGLGAFVLVEAGLEAIGQERFLISTITLLSLVIANLIPNTIKKLTGDREVAMVIMLLFFGTVGVKVDLARFGGDTVMFALFYGLATIIHLAILLGIAKAMKAELQEVLVGSVAGIGGPTSAAAMGATYNRQDLITPGILCALFGYAIATFVGLALYSTIWS